MRTATSPLRSRPGHDGEANRGPTAGQIPVRSVRAGAGSGTWGIERVRGDLAEAAGLEVLHGLPDLSFGVHHEGPVMLDRLADGLAPEEQYLQVGRARVLRGTGSDGQPLPGTERHQLTGANWSTIGTRFARPGQHVGQGVEARRPGQFDHRPGSDRRVHQRDGCMGRTGTGQAGDSPGDHSHQRSRVARRHHYDVGRLEGLVGRWNPLLFGRQVDPKLHAMKKPSGDDQLLRWGLNVENAPPRGHPLGGAVGDDAATPVGVLVRERAVDHVGDGLETAVGMPGRAFRLARGVVDLTHLVHVHEGVEGRERHAGKGATNRKSLPFVTARSGGHRGHGPRPTGGVRSRQSGQSGPVRNVDGRHGASSNPRDDFSE